MQTSLAFEVLMICTTDMYDWEGTPSVKQRLVFLCESDREAFLKAVPSYDDDIEWSSRGQAIENGKGAFAKIRAVRNSNGTWSPCIRSATDGMKIYMPISAPVDGDPEFSTAEEAMTEGFLQFCNYLTTAARELAVLIKTGT